MSGEGKIAGPWIDAKNVAPRNSDGWILTCGPGQRDYRVCLVKHLSPPEWARVRWWMHIEPTPTGPKEDEDDFAHVEPSAADRIDAPGTPFTDLGNPFQDGHAFEPALEDHLINNILDRLTALEESEQGRASDRAVEELRKRAECLEAKAQGALDHVLARLTALEERVRRQGDRARALDGGLVAGRATAADIGGLRKAYDKLADRVSVLEARSRTMEREDDDAREAVARLQGRVAALERLPTDASWGLLRDRIDDSGAAYAALAARVSAIEERG